MRSYAIDISSTSGGSSYRDLLTGGDRQSLSPRRLLACPECDALLSVEESVLSAFHCPRCRCIVVRRAARTLDSARAFYLAASFLFLLANLFPILEIRVSHAAVETTLAGAALTLHGEHMTVIALLVAGTTLVIPAIELLCTSWMLAVAESHHHPGILRLLFRVRQRLRPWNMLEIFVLGVMVALVKLAGLASVVPGTGLWCMAAFMVAHAAASHVLDPQVFWHELRRPR